MQKRTETFAGSRPVYTGSPAVEIGGFNLDESQHVPVGAVIPAGTLCVHNEATRSVKLVKTGKVKAIDSTKKKITLESDEFLCPIFAVGDKIAKAAGGTYADAITITAISDTNDAYVITMSGTITGLAVGDIIGEVVADGANSAFIPGAGIIATPRLVKENMETTLAVSLNTLQWSVFKRRVLPIMDSQLDATGSVLANNHNIRFTNAF
ncbi:MAG: hypothetical protein KBT28_10765 [Bacteroidales bacterium]|nr:hypothetical protein [Candidatus Colimorpha merdihippi]